MMKIALAQISMDVDINKNILKTLKILEEAEDQKADLIFFPELQFSPFFPKKRKQDINKYLLAENDAVFNQIANFAAENNVIVSPNTILKEHDNNYDASLFFNGKLGLQGISKMVHIMQATNFYEQDYYTPSDEGFKVFDTRFGKIGIVICFDRHFPESVRSCALQGANLILIPTANISGEDQDYFEWELKVQAIQNSVFIALCNRVGIEEDVTFVGQSLIIGPVGNILLRGNGQEKILIQDIDLKQSEKGQKNNQYLTLLRPSKYNYKS